MQGLDDVGIEGMELAIIDELQEPALLDRFVLIPGNLCEIPLICFQVFKLATVNTADGGLET